MKAAKPKTRGQRRRVARRLPAQHAGGELTALKFEVAKDLGLEEDIAHRGFANMTTRDVGQIGGQMVRRLVARGKRSLRRRGR